MPPRERLDEDLGAKTVEAGASPPEPAAPALKAGDRFRGLLVHGRLGEGGMGTAWLASHPVLRTPLILKTFSRAGSVPDFAEAQLAARVASPFVVAVLDAGAEEGLPFVIQQYVDGLDLGELCTRWAACGHRLPAGVVARLGAQAARGLHALHQVGVVHRDVKPENLFVRGDGVACVGDLGLALAPSEARGEGQVAGTPHFMAPEQWRGEPLDRRTDLYGLGATLHVLATGDTPFPDGSLAKLGLAHLTTAYLPPRASGPREQALFALVERLLEKERAQRPASAAEVARVLEPLAAPPPAFERIGPAAARIGDLSLELLVGDLAEQRADVLVNAANWRLTMEVGVADSLSRAAGPSLAEEARAQAPATMGDVAWTGAGALEARCVAHAVAALAGAVCIQRCVLRVLLGAEARKLRSVAFPALGTGVGAVPMELGAKLVLEAIATFAALGPTSVRELKIVLRREEARAQWWEAVALA